MPTIPTEFIPFLWYIATALMGAGGAIIAACFAYMGKEWLKRIGKVEEETKYLMAEDKLSKEMAAFYAKEENSRRVTDRRQTERRKPMVDLDIYS